MISGVFLFGKAFGNLCSGKGRFTKEIFILTLIIGKNCAIIKVATSHNFSLSEVRCNNMAILSMADMSEEDVKL